MTNPNAKINWIHTRNEADRLIDSGLVTSGDARVLTLWRLWVNAGNEAAYHTVCKAAAILIAQSDDSKVKRWAKLVDKSCRLWLALPLEERYV